MPFVVTGVVVEVAAEEVHTLETAVTELWWNLGAFAVVVIANGVHLNVRGSDIADKNISHISATLLGGLYLDS